MTNMSLKERFTQQERYFYPEKGFIPLSRANSAIVRTDIVLPEYVDSEQIGLDLKRIHTLCWLGGLRHLKIEGVNNQSATESTPVVVGINGDGSAVAGRAAVGKAEPFHFDDFESGNSAGSIWARHQLTWVDGQIHLNLEAMSKRIVSKSKQSGENLRLPSAWGHLLDQALKEGIANIGINHLIFGVNKPALACLMFLIFSNERLYTATSPSELLTSWLINNSSTLLISLVDGSLTGSEDGYRLSAFFGPQLDRALALKVLSQTQPLVKALPAK